MNHHHGRRKRSRNAAFRQIIILLTYRIGGDAYGIDRPLLFWSPLPPANDVRIYRRQHRRSSFMTTTLRHSSNNNNDNNKSHTHCDSRNDIDIDSKVAQPRRQRQIRKKSIDRRPRYYWCNNTNLRHELIQFWSTSLGVDTNHTAPTIPNERLLMYYGRHDIRAAIAKNGGRSAVSVLLNNAPIMPGRWKDTRTSYTSSSTELQQLLIHRALISNNETSGGVQQHRPPWTTTVTTTTQATANKTVQELWSHHDGRNQKGYWNLQNVIQELYEYVDQYKVEHDRPSVWMPRPSELANNGRDDLRQAMNRYGGVQNICRTAGMISFQEWFYFEGQLELFMGLKHYLDEYAHGDYTKFPTVSDIKRNGYDQLHNLIQYYGGRKFLSARLNMSIQKTKVPTRKKKLGFTSNHISIGSDDTIIKFGLFDLIFAIRLLSFVRLDLLQRNPPLQSPVIAMPSRTKLLRYPTTNITTTATTTATAAIVPPTDGEWLDTKIDEFGGYENVARRLGLALFAVTGTSYGDGKLLVAKIF